jgi:hypothetical protein
MMNTGKLNLSVNTVPTLLVDMNLLPNSRIGWEEKQAHTHRLIEAHSDGRLTNQEYEARMLWISDAQTIEQIKLAFKDLPPLRITGLEFTPGTLHTTPKRNVNSDVIKNYYYLIMFAASFSTMTLCILERSGLFYIPLIFTIIFGVILNSKIRKAN